MPSSPSSSARHTTVLVVDDDVRIRQAACTALEQDGHSVALATDGDEACRLFSEQSPDLVLLDTSRPGLDGYGTCAKLRRRDGGTRTPILLLAGSDDTEAIARAYEAGATDFQTKPVNWRVLRERVKYMLRAKRDADALLRLALYDNLTGLLNRSTFRDRLTRALARSAREDAYLATIFVDLDGFKEINDTFGHGFGDQILRLTGQRLTHNLRSGDSLSRPGRQDVSPAVGRFGGDEFTIVVPSLPSVETATAIADRIGDAFTDPFEVEGREVFVTVSTGVSVYPFDGTDADTLLKHADAAMYAAKSMGRNNHCHYRSSMGTSASERVAMARELRHALEHDELRVFFQPKVDVGTRQIVGAEALIRWQHPQRGLVEPLEFLGLAEEIGMGPPIGDWVMRSALLQSSEWRGWDHQALPVAANLSNSQFHINQLLDRIVRTIDETGLDASSLEVEFTETVVIHNRLAARELLEGFKSLGIRTAIDDFGTGQSALGTLKDLAVDALKIDRSFIGDLEDSQSDRAIAASIIDMGHHLGMTVIAEGVETPGQMELLGEMGCDQVQGYLFSRPVPTDAFKQLLSVGPLDGPGLVQAGLLPGVGGPAAMATAAVEPA